MEDDRRFARTRILALFSGGAALNVRRAAAGAFVSVRQASWVIKRLREEEHLVYISSWQRGVNGKRWTPMYRLGNLPDAVRPKGQTSAQKTARYRARLLNEDMRADFFRNVDSARRRVIRPDKLAMALMPWLYQQREPLPLVVTKPIERMRTPRAPVRREVTDEAAIAA